MIYAGIDIAKQNHIATAMSADGEIIFEPFGFTNDNSGFQKLLDNLSSFDKEEMLVGMESTAHYAENLTCFLFSRDLISVSLIRFRQLPWEKQIFVKPRMTVLIPT